MVPALDSFEDRRVSWPLAVDAEFIFSHVLGELRIPWIFAEAEAEPSGSAWRANIWQLFDTDRFAFRRSGPSNGKMRMSQRDPSPDASGVISSNK